ncbi:conjugal transfer protein TraI [Bacteroides intestinalis]|uniref:Conjugal transfer protein TraI n=1 Tax=Bacteroides intestinalis TaxID=329854 RepID=A0AAQ0LR88_9BACE|nr:conjugal transfer protein TraI [Bacteroides intestinalis]RGT54652.1 conjugal transfer protein TraI [Bacteroides intestinalis]
MNRLILLVESRIRGDVYVRFGGELPKTHRSNTAGRWMLSLPLKSVNNLVKDARKVQKTILMIGEISDTYVVSFQKMMRDENYTVEELGAIAFGYTKLLEESNDVLQEMKGVVNITTLSLSDKERMDVVDRCYNSVRQYRNLIGYYTNKNIAVSYLRSKKKGDTNRVLALYGDTNDRYW